ncbi:MAG: hypothetical protein IPM64_09605 [Phycisphaerales bacterium]|nr:hypothetical protein [Phycisphaerales bacterium]
MFRRALVLWLTGSVVAGAAAAPYYVAYEGNDFPENEGWERLYGDENGEGNGGATRSLVNGELVLDSLRSPQIYDSYLFRRALNPGPGEFFFFEWRLNVLANNGPAADSIITIARDGRGTLSLQVGNADVYSEREFWRLPLMPGVPHAFRVESADMLSYSLYVDGTFARNGIWDLNSLNESYVGFGDGRLGGGVTSLASWDYVRFGTVPEPAASALGSMLLALFLRIRK